MSNIKTAFDCVFPICMILVIGYGFGQRDIVPRSFFSQLSKLNFFVLSFFLLFDSVYHADLSVSFRPDVVVFLCLFVLLSFLVAGAIIPHRIVDRRVCGAVWQTTFRANIGVIGIALARDLMDDPSMEVFVVAILGAMANVLGVIALETLRGGDLRFGELLHEVCKNPLVLGCLLGLLCNLLRLSIPVVIDNTMTKLGNAAVPMSLLTLGATLDLRKLRENRLRVLFCSALRLVIIPAAAVLLGSLLGFRGDPLCAIMLTTAMPLPTAAFTMAQVYESDDDLTGQIVVTSSVLCCLTLFCWIVLLKQLSLI